ncbi:MAG: NfeD family protein [Planctomycetaceae bacterium]
MTLIHAFIMIVLFLVLLTLELFIPSGGLLGIAAAASLIAAIVLGFMHSMLAGASILVGSAVLVPIGISIGLRIWPRTAMGRRMLTQNPEANAAFEAELRAEREAMIGKTGVALSDMLPAGLVEIEGQRRDAISTGMAIDRGQRIEVVSVTSGKIHVRPIVVDPGHEHRPAVPESLEMPIESLGMEDWK